MSVDQYPLCGKTFRLAFAGLTQEWLDAEVPLLSKTGVGLKNL